MAEFGGEFKGMLAQLTSEWTNGITPPPATFRAWDTDTLQPQRSLGDVVVAEKPVKYDKRRYKRRNRIEIMFGRLKDWRRVATRYDRCPKVFLSAIALAALVIYWL